MTTEAFWLTKNPGAWSEKERRQYVAMQFEPAEWPERLLVVRDVAPDVWSSLPWDTRREAEEYEVKRTAKRELDGHLVQTIAINRQAIDAAATTVRAGRPTSANDRHRAELAAAVRGDGDPLAVLRAWGESFRAERRAWSEYIAARTTVGFPHGAIIAAQHEKPNLAGELAKAIDGLADL